TVWHKKPSWDIKADKVSAASVGREEAPASETRRSGESTVPVYLTRARPRARPRHYIRRISSDPRCGTKVAHESQSGQVNGSASIRHNVGPHLLQPYGVSFGGPDGEERRGNCGEHQRAANCCENKCFHSNLRFGTDAKRLLPVQARHWQCPVVRTHRCQMDRRKKVRIGVR